MRQDESRLQRACVKWFRLRYHRFAPLLFAVPNGGARDTITGARLKAEGVVPGVADLILLLPRGGAHALCIELKTPKGRQRDTQRAWQDAVTGQGYAYVICRSLDAFVALVSGYIDEGVV